MEMRASLQEKEDQCTLKAKIREIESEAQAWENLHWLAETKYLKFLKTDLLSVFYLFFKTKHHSFTF